jgi:hypothetical protein
MAWTADDCSGAASAVEILRGVVEGRVRTPEAIAERTIRNPTVRDEGEHTEPGIETPATIAKSIAAVR